MKASRKIIALTASVALAIGLAACDKKPTGQIVAVVNGEEISLAELNQELTGAKIPENADKKAIMRQVLERVVDRRLLAQAAKEQGIDRDPTYVSMQRRMSEDLLVQMYAKKAADGIKVPDAAAIDKYINENPTLFAERARLKLDQIVFPMPSNPDVLRQFEKDNSLAAVAATLGRLNIKFAQGEGALDTATVPPKLLQQINALPAGEPFIVPTNGRVVVSVIKGREPVVIPAAQARPLAVEAMRRQGLSKIGESRLKEARAKAKIEYQADYAPTPAGKAPPAPTKS
ncbi:MAG: EpsD family peptidyl-prolyl cis-trans isomerase [Sphingomonadaceae bacterium]